MGEHWNTNLPMEVDRTAFMQELLSDVHALERMLQEGVIEKESVRIGAEQEFFLINSLSKASLVNTEILRLAKDSHLSPELARFNLEANLNPVDLSHDALRQMESQLLGITNIVRVTAAELGSRVLLTGILPTLTLDDLTLDQMTDVPRYHQLNYMLSHFRNGPFLVHIKGIDEINFTHGNMMLEACNTSFQIHLQINPERFAEHYNVAQLISAPVLAAAVNSPLLFGKRLWAETRLALFQHSVDERSEIDHIRDRSPRVSFGTSWVNHSVIDLFRNDIARFRVLLMDKVEEDPMQVLSQGGVPRLSALSIHNGTIWRWNRPCYGILNGRPHLRIESRFLPAGPTIPDQVANAAFFYGLMIALPLEFGPVDRLIGFDEAKANFFAAARHGLEAQLRWVQGKTYPAARLILDKLLPLAEAGLQARAINPEDIKHYLDIIRCRVETGQTGAHWMLQTFERTTSTGATLDMRLRALTECIMEQQDTGNPVHEWPLRQIALSENPRANYETVGQYMSTALITVQPDDRINYAASIMQWQHIRHIPVENEQGSLVGLVSQSDLVLLLAQGLQTNPGAIPVRDVMKTHVITVRPETQTTEAIQLMKQYQIGCLPVVHNGKLVGIITTYDILGIGSKLLEKSLF